MIAEMARIAGSGARRMPWTTQPPGSRESALSDMRSCGGGGDAGVHIVQAEAGHYALGSRRQLRRGTRGRLDGLGVLLVDRLGANARPSGDSRPSLPSLA